jgi:carboxypeptidase Taq
MNADLAELKSRLAEIDDLNAAGAVLSWDQHTYMPPGGAAARGRQLATLTKLAHEKFTTPALGRLLDRLTDLPDPTAAALIRVTRRDYERAVKVPATFMAELSEHTSATYVAWTKARPANDFKAVQPLLEKTLDLSRHLAGYFPGHAHIADPLIDYADPGITVATLRPLFAALRDQLVPLVQTITAQPVPDAACLRQSFPAAAQLAFGHTVLRQFGYDFQRGRQDQTPHPFMTKFSLGDVRITTRVHEHDLSEALFSTLHEAGHAMYELGIRPDFEATPLGSGASSGIHESQSRLWENVVGRSRGFWEHFYPPLQTIFPAQLRDVALDDFYRAINKVERSLIRTDADEVTYNLHVLLRFDLELQLLEGRLAIRDLPEAWHARYQTDLGVRAPDDRDGVLQDVHWYGGLIGGAFQGYTLGNLLSAQFYEAATRAQPGIPDQIRRGEFATLHGWLREHLYQHGRQFDPADLIQRATGQPLTIEPYLRYLRQKYGALYRL